MSYEDFLSEKVKVPTNRQQGLPWFDQQAKAASFTFLSQNRSLIEHEFNDLFVTLKQHDQELLFINKKIEKLELKTNTAAEIAVLNSRKEVLEQWIIERRGFWLNCYYYARLLKEYHDAYGKESNYGKWCIEIQERINSPTLIPAQETKAWMTKLLDDVRELASTPWRIGKIRDWVAFANIYRIHTVFCRLTAKGFLNIAAEFKLLDSLKSLLGWEVNIPNLDAPANVYNAASVGLFAIRFMIHTGLLVKHVFVPTDKERDGEHWYDHAYERFIAELNKRYCVMLNDVAWSSVNALSNYAIYFNLSSTFANWLTAGFLCFDVALLIWRRRLEEQDYLLKKQQYLTELGVLDINDLNDVQPLERKILLEQLKRLEARWEAKSATYWFDVAAAAVLLASFSTAIFITSPAIVTPLCFLAITIGASMYLCDGYFQSYQEKKSMLKYIPLDEASTPAYKAVVAQQLNDSWNTFLMSLLKCATIPLFITTAFAVSPPVAILLTGLYIAYENGQKYVTRPEPLAATLLITGALFVSWPLALSMTALYLGYEMLSWALGSTEEEALSLPAPGR